MVICRSDSYTLSQTIMETNVTSSQVVACQNGKKYNIPYVVYEKTFPCKNYPPDEVITFSNIIAECDGVGELVSVFECTGCRLSRRHTFIDCVQSIEWTSAVKDANCNMKANIIDQKTISITWDTTAVSQYDDFTDMELYALNHHGWATRLSLSPP